MAMPTDTDRRLIYCAAELGEDLKLEAAGTVSSKMARNGAVVLASGTTKTNAKLHVKRVDPTIVNAP